MKQSIALSACATLLPVAVWAYQPLVTDDTGTQGAGGNQLEAAYNRTRATTAGSRTITHELPLLYTRGITDALDLYTGIVRQQISPDPPGAVARGWGNTAVGAKWRFYHDESRALNFALKPEIQFPVSRNRETRGLGSARMSYGLDLLMTKDTVFGAAHANLAGERVNYADGALNAAERRTRYRLSIAPVWDVAEGWKLAIDTGVMTNPDRLASARMGYIELGAIYSPHKNMDIALGAIRNVMDGDASTWQATVGLTWRAAGELRRKRLPE